MIGEGVSMTGTWMQAMAQGWVMTTLSHSAFMLGMVHFAAGIPQLLLSMVGGSLADRHDKRLILLWTQVVQIVCAIVMGVLVLTGTIAMWHVMALAVLLGVSNAFEMPAASAIVPELVEPEEISSAIAVDRSLFHATRLIGPALAGAVIGWWGTASAFFANAASFLALMLALTTLKPRAQGSEAEEEQRKGGFKDGLAYVRSDAPTMAMITLFALSTFCVFPVMMVLLPLYARDELGLAASGMGALMSASAVGSFTGSIVLLSIRRERRRQTMLAVALGAAVAIGGLSVATRPMVAAVILATMAACVSTLMGLGNTTVQERTPAHLRGRVSAIAGLSFFGLMPFAGLGISALSDAIGMRTSLALAALTFGLGAGYVLMGPARRAAEPPADLTVAAEPS
jgi:MFS family permease